MTNQTRVFISTSLLNHAVSFPSYKIIIPGRSEKYSFQDKSLNQQRTENLREQEERITPGQPGTGTVPDSIDSPKERRKGGPQEEFIEVDPNWSKEKNEEKNDVSSDRSRNEDEKDN